MLSESLPVLMQASEFLFTNFLTMTTNLLSALDVSAKLVRMTLAITYDRRIVVQPCWFTNMAEGLTLTKYMYECDETFKYFHISYSHL